MGLEPKYALLRWGLSDPKPAIHDHDDEDSELEGQEASGMVAKRRIPRCRRYATWILHGAFIISYALIFPHLQRLWDGRENPRGCVDKTYSYSPINDAIEEEYVGTWFQGSLWYDSPYKGPPTPEVEQAWQNLMQYGAVSISAEDILGIGHNLTAVQYPPEVGGGYLGVALGVHQLHCLHYVWQDHHIAYFEKTQANKAGVPEMYERHYEHCIDFIRQALMCNFDTGILPFYWVNQHQQPTPDGNTFHKCVNWDSLQGWLKERAVDLPEGYEWHQPPDAEPLPQNP